MDQIETQEIDARIMALISQRNRAMDEAVVLSGRVAVLEKQIKDLKEAAEKSKTPDEKR